MRTRTVVLIAGGLCAAALAAGMVAVDRLAAAADREDRTCTQQAQADAAAIRTGRDWTADDVPGIGDYVEIHWQAGTLGVPCSRAPGPTDWRAEGVLRLRDTDAAAFAAWPAATGAPPVRDTLRPFLPEAVRWRHGGDFPRQHKGRTVDLYADPDRAVAWFTVSTA
ncbi:hypothetical protein [Dactylosporangium aurantiacum]|uniref:hypothetical protein n=1 Tax=Dactylosporangium aurantiacum TaxID=35754 RepID=UPI0012DC2896|nr:hypothetical protein [Dactylosporangium aurantiacum]MDG6105078.1 hypothetical protein [Dactylosporangium aurantiacum]